VRKRNRAVEEVELLLFFLHGVSKSMVWAKEGGGSRRFRKENRDKHVMGRISKKSWAKTFV